MFRRALMGVDEAPVPFDVATGFNEAQPTRGLDNS